MEGVEEVLGKCVIVGAVDGKLSCSVGKGCWLAAGWAIGEGLGGLDGFIFHVLHPSRFRLRNSVSVRSMAFIAAATTALNSG